MKLYQCDACAVRVEANASGGTPDTWRALCVYAEGPLFVRLAHFCEAHNGEQMRAACEQIALAAHPKKKKGRKR